MTTHPPNHTTHFFKSLDSPCLRTVRKTHLRNRPQTEKTLSFPAKMRNRGMIKEYRHLGLHLCLLVGVSAVLGLVHIIFTAAKKRTWLFVGTLSWNIVATSIPKCPEFSPR